MASRWITFLGLALALFGAWALRARGIGYELPQWTHSDGYVLRNQAAYLRGEMSAEEVRESTGYYPALPIAAVAYLPQLEPNLEGLDPLVRALEVARAPWVHIRRVSVWLSLGAVAATYGLARRFLGRGPSWFAVALTATSLLHVTYSTAQRPHGMLSSATALAVLVLLESRRRSGLGWRLAGALGVAVGVATLQSGLALVPAWIVAWWRRRVRASPGAEAAAAVLSLALVALVAAWAYAAFATGGSGGGDEAADGTDLALAGRHYIRWSDSLGQGAVVLARAFAFYDPVIAVGLLAALSALATPALRRRAPLDSGTREDLWVCLGFVLPYAGFFALFGRTLDRFALPLIPFAAVAAAWGFHAWRRAWLGDRRRGLAVALAALLLALPTFACWRLGTLRSRPDTLELAARWIRDHSGPGQRKVVLAALNLELPFFYSEESLATLDNAGMAYWTRFQRGLDAPSFAGERFDVERERNLADYAASPGGVALWNPDFVVLHTSGVRARDELFSAELKRWRESGTQSIVISPAAEPEESLRRESPVRDQPRPVQMYGIAEAPTLPLLFGAERLGPRLRILYRDPDGDGERPPR
jgi:hypothetical protein